MAYKPKVLAVADGGTSDTSLTAYAVICGGTTGTGAIQSIAGVGTSGQILTSNGAGALPTFQTSSSGTTSYVIYLSTASTDPAASSTYIMVNGYVLQASGGSIYIPVTGTITKAYGNFTVGGTLGSSQNNTVFIRLNNTTDTNITTTLKLNTASNLFNGTGLSISVSAGDFIQVKLTTGAFTTNPTTVRGAISIVIQQ